MIKKILVGLLFLLAFTACAFAQEVKASMRDLLNVKVSLKVDSLPIDKIFDILSKQTGCYFTYNAEQIDGNKLVSINLNDEPLTTVLDTVLNNPKFTYQLVNNQVVIHPFKGTVTHTDLLTPKTLTINGKVIDKTSGQPLPFASVVLKNTYIGGITNEQGVFIIKIPPNMQTDTLVFYYMGYYSAEIQVSDTMHNITVALNQGVVSIQEVIIRNANPELLIKKARSLLRENYFDAPYNYNAFYREAVKKSSRYMVYSEALISGYKPSFLMSGATNKVQLERSRKFTNIQKSDTLLIKLRGGMEACFQLDLIHELPDFLSENGMQQYNYTIADITIWNDELVYVIGFKQKEYISEALFEGVIYLSVNKSVILGADFSFSKDRLRKTGNIFVIKKSRQVNIKPIGTAYQVQYANLNGKYFTKHVRGELTFKVRKGRNIIRENYATVLEMVYTQIDTLNVSRPVKKDLFQTNTIFSDSQYNYDTDFWQTGNTITPEENIQDALKSFSFKLQQQGE